LRGTVLFKWQESLCIGVLEIDIQHKLLFEKFNAFLDACEAQTESDGIYRLFWFLEAYTITHFTQEEKLMQEMAYPDFPRHRELHRTFTTEVGKLKERLRVEGPTETLVSHMRMFISGWLVEHISNIDRALAAFVTSSEVPAMS
jgi:hemerythrin